MKKSHFFILAFLSFFMGIHGQCFIPVATHLYGSMQIYVSLATLYGTNLQEGDEIGVFDGDLCVGVGVLTEELGEESDYLLIEASRQFLWWPGFTPGDTITYRFCSGGEIANPTIVPTYIRNGPTFEPNGSCIVELRSINTAPVVTSVPVTEALTGSAYSYTIVAEDRDGDALTYTATVLPGWLDFDTSTHTLAATPGEEDEGDQHVSIWISDGSISIDHTFIISVSCDNHAPTFTSEPETSTLLGDTYSYTISAEDIDGDTLSYTAPQIPAWLTFHPETHTITGVPDSSDLGRHDVVLRVSDGIISADQAFPIFVENKNAPPCFTSTPLTSISVGDLYVYRALAEDPDGDELNYSAPVLPAWLSFDVNTHSLHGTPGNNDAGDHNVSLQVTDGELAENQHFVIRVDFVYGIGELALEEFIRIYPNPGNGRFNIEISRELETELSLEILDPLGRILQKEVFPPYFLIRQEYNLHNSSPGIYLIRIYDNTSHLIRKLIVN